MCRHARARARARFSRSINGNGRIESRITEIAESDALFLSTAIAINSPRRHVLNSGTSFYRGEERPLEMSAPERNCATIAQRL